MFLVAEGDALGDCRHPVSCDLRVSGLKTWGILLYYLGASVTHIKPEESFKKKQLSLSVG
jgi:hypothetical protein